MEGVKEKELLEQAKEALANCDVLFVFTGAGCSKDSGLPVFNEVPNYQTLCSPTAMRETPLEFYKFFRSAASRYEMTVPHEGYQALRRIIDKERLMALVATSNVDGALQKSGLSNVIEIHGTLRSWQCGTPCCKELFAPPLDSNDCPFCGAPARPYVLLFEDHDWIGLESMKEMTEISAVATRAKKLIAKDPSLKLCILEIGCGDRVPTMRSLGEDFLAQLWSIGVVDPESPRARLIRINPDPLLAGIVRESAKFLKPLIISLCMGAKEALLAIE